MTAKEILTNNLDQLIDMLDNDYNYREIAKKFNVSLASVSDFINKSEHSARCLEALERSAQIAFDKAEESIKELKSGDDTAIIARQRELAHHYRRKAGIKNKNRFSEKNQSDVNISFQDAFVLKRVKSSQDQSTSSSE